SVRSVEILLGLSNSESQISTTSSLERGPGSSIEAMAHSGGHWRTPARAVDAPRKEAVMTRISRRMPLPSHLRPALLSFLGIGLGLALRSEAATLSAILTAADRSRPELLDQNGRQLQLPSRDHPHPALPQGTIATYLAFPLYGDKSASGGSIGIPTI